MEKPYCILFAGVVGSSKTPIAHVLSCAFGLPILNKDAIRTEVVEDLRGESEAEAARRVERRLHKMLATQQSFILDASVDRTWNQVSVELTEAGYAWFVISLDWSIELLSELLIKKGYNETYNRLNDLQAEHQRFLNEHGGIVGVHLTDPDFSERLVNTETAVSRWLKNN